jgi:hypothetical protein
MENKIIQNNRSVINMNIALSIQELLSKRDHLSKPNLYA